MRLRRLSREEHQRCAGSGDRSAFGLGRDYFRDNLGITQNPFPQDCEEWDEFRQGWFDSKLKWEEKQGKPAKNRRAKK